eukprot:jgi/Ulvmu1/8607/UM046_0005.1
MQGSDIIRRIREVADGENMSSKLINESSSMQLSTLITNVRRAKTAAEERAIIKKESAYIRTVLGSEPSRHAKRNLVKLMYMRMLGYPSEFGQVPCLALITKGDYSAKRVGYLGLMLLLDETHETLMMVTNSLKTDLGRFGDPYILLNALTALANICSGGMAADLAPEVERLCDGKLLQRNGVNGALAGHVRKKALLAASRMVSRAPALEETFRDVPGSVIPDGNHAVVMAGVTLMLTCMDADSTGKVLEHYRTTKLAGQASQMYPQLLTAVLGKLHQSKGNFEYVVNGVCNPYLQVKVLKTLGRLGKGSPATTEQMSDILAKVAAAHASPPSKLGRAARSTSAAVAMEAANTILEIAPVQMLRSYAVQIMANFLKQQDNNMRYVALNTLLRCARTDLGAVQRHRAMIVECVKDADTSIRKRALALVGALVNDTNVKALSRELVAHLEATDDAFKPSLAEHLCTLLQKHSPSTRWYVDQLLRVMVIAGEHLQDNVSRAFVVRVSNSDADMQAYVVRQALRTGTQHRESGSDLLLCTCVWALGEFGELLDGAAPLLEDEVPWAGEPGGQAAAAAQLLEQLTQAQRSSEVHAYATMAAIKLLGRLPDAQRGTLLATLQRCMSHMDVEVQQRSCEVGQVLKLKDSMPPELIERIPPLDEATYAGNLRDDVVTIDAAAATADTAGGAAADLLGDLLDISDPANAPAAGAAGGGGGAAAAAAEPRSVLDDLDDLLGGGPVAAPAAPAAVAAPPPPPPPVPPAAAPLATFRAWTSPQDGLEIDFSCTAVAGAAAPTTDITASYRCGGAAALEGLKVLAAVPKGMTVEVRPAAGGEALQPARANTITQRLTAVNNTDGAKALAMRLKVSYSVGGTAREHLGVVNGFPPGL